MLGHAGCGRISVRFAMQTLGPSVRSDLAALLALALIVALFLAA